MVVERSDHGNFRSLSESHGWVVLPLSSKKKVDHRSVLPNQPFKDLKQNLARASLLKLHLQLMLFGR